MIGLSKPQKNEKRKKHKKSILHYRDGTCYLCMKLNSDYRKHQVFHEHHIFAGSNRSISEAEGMKVYLCLQHHIDGSAAVHNNQANMRILQQDGQRAYERTHTRAQFMERFGRNYLEDDEKELQGQQEETEPGFWLLENEEGSDDDGKDDTLDI